ncbi:MAG: NADH:ubiquinone reductase (Na(+)-transporting) subunit C [Tannerellaceae bacterium]|jgi:Na+-transporting NADH:ubiquinone oxidoreductase subunit C|nr:NADH:ubiquinone reductase (Na(+)-transporting) subunit C [Tannerellaceae bacterium]
MKRDSNGYTVIYASVLVVLVAVMLAFTSQSLQSFQKTNEENDKRRQILRSIHIDVAASEAESSYKALIQEAFLVNGAGKQIEGDAFGADIMKTFAEGKYPVFVAEVKGETKYIMALQGSGLWGPIWGYIAIDADCNTVYGADFSHAGETPGLGAEIVTTWFSKPFSGKHLFQEGRFTSVAVVKPGKEARDRDYVDGISGGTITSAAVDRMLFESLTAYVAFLSTDKEEEDGSVDK